MSKVTEAEILEDISKVLIKLKDFEKVEFTSNDDGRTFVPTKDDIYDEDEEAKYLDENGNLKPDAMYDGYYSGAVKFQENYENFKLSTIKQLLTELIRNDKLQDADGILAKYYTSTCWG